MSPPPRDPESTRRHILEVSAEEMLTHGYKAASLSDILKKAGVSKGALYHHFDNKQELGYAVLQEVFIPVFLEGWEIPHLANSPLQELKNWVENFRDSVEAENLVDGCPICNIATEMSNSDEGFRDITYRMFELLAENIAKRLRLAKAQKKIRDDFDIEGCANFILAVIQGLMMQGKYARDIELFRSTLDCLLNYIESIENKNS